jgi:methyl-accepting chemotaxis protein
MVYFVVTDLSAQIEFADKERLGAEYIAPLVRFQRAVIDYRTGIASPPAVDGTSEATEAGLAAAVERAAQEVRVVDQRNGGTLRVADLWEIASRDWTRIASGMQDVTREQRLAVTDTLLVRLRKSIQDVADGSNLTLDPEIHTYYLMDTVSQKIPQALQFLGDGRDAGIASGDSAALADMVRFRSDMTNAAVASDQIRNSVKRAVQSYVPLDRTVGPAAKKAQDAIKRVVRFAEIGIPDLAAVAAVPNSSGTPFEIRDVSAWREATGRAVEALAATADESAGALQRLLEARVTDLKATLWMRVVFTVGFCLVAVVMLRILSANQVRVARERNEEAARIAAENQSNQRAILLLMDELAEISEGNLAARTTVTPEITGAIADSINATVTELYGVVTGIDTAARQVTGATDEARVVASGLASSARAQSTRIKDAATAVQLMTRSITEVSETATRSADVAKHTLDAAETGAQAVHSSIANMESITRPDPGDLEAHQTPRRKLPGDR